MKENKNIEPYFIQKIKAMEILKLKRITSKDLLKPLDISLLINKTLRIPNGFDNSETGSFYQRYKIPGFTDWTIVSIKEHDNLYHLHLVVELQNGGITYNDNVNITKKQLLKFLYERA
jgi:hypothetical protein